MRKADIHDSCSYLSALCLIPHRWSEEITLTFITENIQEGGFLAAPPVFKASFDKHRILQFEKIDYKCLLSFSFFFSTNPEFCYLILILISYLQLFCLHMQGNKSSPTSNASLDNVVKLTA